ncbi:TetR/AcrR family transcriptional regulator [Flindersiella endophytica]
MAEYTGTGDPARSLALLWRAFDKPSRGGGLSVDTIVRTAISVADAEGLGALSMRRVALELGVGTMSLYTHVPGKGELIDLMEDVVLGETARPALAGASWRQRLEQVAHEHWKLYHRHRWLLQVVAHRPPLGPNLMAKYEYELRAVDGVGLTELEMDSIVALVTSFVHGAARSAVDAARNTEETGVTDRQWWAAHAPYLGKLMDASRFPLAAKVGAVAGEELGAAYDPAHTFTFGLKCILDGVEALVSSRRP